MAEVKEITPHYDRKVQLDDFEPINHGATLTIAVEDDEDWEEVYEDYAEVLEDAVERELARRVAAKKLAGEEDDD